jgi:AraC-like DNA-binding protein
VTFLKHVQRTPQGFSPSAATMVASKTLGPVQLAQVRAPNGRDDPGSAYTDPKDSFVWAFVTSGAIVSHRGSLQIPCTAGHLAVSHMPQVSGFQVTQDFRSLSIRIARSALPLTATEVEAVSRTTFILEEGAPRLMGSMASYVMSLRAPLGPASQAAFAQSVIDLTRAFVDDVLGQHTEPAVEQRMLLGRARDYIARHAASPSTTPSMVAEQMGVSLRTLQKLFEREESTLATEILSARLARARVLLERSKPEAVSIRAVAERAGFRSASGFSRAFANHFGQAPRDWRQRTATDL